MRIRFKKQTNLIWEKDGSARTVISLPNDEVHGVNVEPINGNQSKIVCTAKQHLGWTAVLDNDVFDNLDKKSVQPVILPAKAKEKV
jgi:hypothetical protein